MGVETLTTISPTTNQPILERKGPTNEELATIASNAHKAFLSYRKTPLSERQAIVRKALQLLTEQKDELAQDLTEQMGRPISYGAKEVSTAVLRGEHMLKTSDDALKDTPGEPQAGFKRWVRKEPLGPVLVLFAWNYPYLILINSLVPALLAGNSIILKPSPQTPTIVERVASIFATAGLPKNVLQYFHSSDFSQISSLIQNPLISLVSFTGSLAGGLAVQGAAASRIDLRVSLELGGNDPAYVRSDADPSWAAEEIADGAIFNSGQSCCSLERIYVHESIHDPFVAALQRVLSTTVLGDPRSSKTTLGPVISKAAKQRIQSHVEDAIAKGAVDSTPSNPTFASPPADGNYLAPTLLTACTPSMLVMRDETFGPIIPVQRVSSDEEAIALMNDSSFGLTASIWTKDVARGEEIADEVEAGTVFVNRADYPSPDLVWGGWKESGRGVALGGRFGFEQFVRLRSWHVKDYPAGL